MAAPKIHSLDGISFWIECPNCGGLTTVKVSTADLLREKDQVFICSHSHCHISDLIPGAKIQEFVTGIFANQYSKKED